MSNYLTMTIYGNSEVMPDGISLGLENTIPLNFSSRILAASNQEFHLEQKDWVSPVLEVATERMLFEQADSSQLKVVKPLQQTEPTGSIAKFLDQKLFSTDDLVSLASKQKLAVEGDIIDPKTSISPLSYGCGCPSCQGLNQNLVAGSSTNDSSNLASVSTTPTGIYYIDALLPPDLPRWNSTIGSSTTVTYSFMTAVPSYDNEPRPGFVALNATQKDGARKALQLWSDVSGITFVETTNGLGKIQFGTFDFSLAPDPSGATAFAYYPGSGLGGDIWLNASDDANLNQTPGKFGFKAMLHEIGHAIGLKHPGDYGPDDPPPYLPTAEDNDQFSLMSYDGGLWGDSYTGNTAHPSTPQLYDIAAIQYLYGADYNTRTGNNIYSWGSNEVFLQTIWDAGGIDTISAANQIVDAKINLNAGYFSSIGLRKASGTPESATDNLAIAFNVTIENAEGGSGNDTLNGNQVANNLSGGNGDDSFYGGEGSDTLIGGDGQDTFYNEIGNDAYQGGAGIDRLLLYGDSYTLSNGNLQNNAFEFNTLKDAIEQIEFTGSNGASIINAAFYSQGSVKIVGNAGNDQLFGGSGDDTIDGAGYTGSSSWIDLDYLDGGAGNDYLIGDSDSRNDFSSDTLIGGAGNDTLNGGRDNDNLSGGADNDTLNGGSGDDTLDGGTGIDTVVDFVNTNATLTDTKLYNDNLISIEQATLTGSSQNNNVSATAFSGHVTFFGGDGHDTIFGGGGNLTVFGENGHDLVNGGVGNDPLSGGDGNDSLYGNAGSDAITGGEGNDILDGGIGVDPLIGGGGNDTYYVDNSADLVTETSTTFTDIDTVYASVNYSLSANVENLILTGTAINGIGNNLSNSLTGNSLNNNLSGEEGDDTLNGGTGHDTLVGSYGFDSLFGGEGNDLLDGSLESDYLDGGKGDDILKGGIGSDTYVVDSIGDVVIEPGFAEDPVPFPTALAAIAPEFDKVFASVNYSLSENVEALYLQGKTNLTGTGNYLNNTLVGGDGNDTLTGAGGKDVLIGGAGNDVLIGGADSDQFVFSGDAPFTRPSKAVIVDPALGVDRIEFESGDNIILDKTVFSSLQSIAGTGFSVANEFALVSGDIEVATSQALIVYSQGTGNLFYNQNSTNTDLGSGGLFATLVNSPVLTAGDFVLQV